MKLGPDAKLVKALAKQFRYCPLPDSVDKEVLIHDLESVEGDLRAALGNRLPAEARLAGPDRQTMRAALAKYGIIDLRFVVPAKYLNTDCRSGIDLLKELGFVMEPEEAEQFQTVADLVGDNFDDPTCLTELKEEVDEDQVYVLLFLRSEPARMPGFRREIDQLPPDYLPRTFVVEDAAITNAALAWLHKHFYL